ncbi:hypothetical protein PO909_010620 [Leuciscus waleckii]
MDVPNGQPSVSTFTTPASERSSSSESLSEKGPSEVKSFDAVVFDVLKVTPEEYAVSQTRLTFHSPRLHLVLNRD